MKRLVIPSLAALLVSSPVCLMGSGIGAAAGDAVNAALRIFTHIAVINAALGQCVAADVENAHSYTDVFAEYTKETLPILNRMTQISQAEEQRVPSRRPPISSEIARI